MYIAALPTSRISPTRSLRARRSQLRASPRAPCDGLASRFAAQLGAGRLKHPTVVLSAKAAFLTCLLPLPIDCAAKSLYGAFGAVLGYLCAAARLPNTGLRWCMGFCPSPSSTQGLFQKGYCTRPAPAWVRWQRVRPLLIFLQLND